MSDAALLSSIFVVTCFVVVKCGQVGWVWLASWTTKGEEAKPFNAMANVPHPFGALSDRVAIIRAFPALGSDGWVWPMAWKHTDNAGSPSSTTSPKAATPRSFGSLINLALVVSGLQLRLLHKNPVFLP